MEWLFYVVSMLYTIVLIVTVGLTLVETYFCRSISEQFLHRQQKYRRFAVKLFFVLVLCSVFEQSIMWLDQFGRENIDFSELFLKTLTGQVWVAIFALAFIGLLIQKLPSVVTMIWGLLLLGVESYDGHISSLESYMIVFDFIHLLCAAIWVGGIATFILNWKQGKDELLPMLQSFMNVMWLTIIVMFISGTVMAVVIVPDSIYFIYSTWGQWLIVKVLVVAVALYCGYYVRHYVKKQELTLGKVLQIEAIALTVVLLLAGLITVLSPEPKDNTLNSHKMGEELHYTVELTPNRPGPNTLNITLWTLEQEGEIEHINVTLIDQQKGERTAKSYDLTEVALVDPYNFMGFIESRYTYVEPIRLPYPSEWKQEVTISFTSGLERTFSIKFEN